ncbi:hypothetical protein SODG_004166 [Sodalis praecaptivus]
MLKVVYVASIKKSHHFISARMTLSPREQDLLSLMILGLKKKQIKINIFNRTMIYLHHLFFIQVNCVSIFRCLDKVYTALLMKQLARLWSALQRLKTTNHIHLKRYRFVVMRSLRAAY